VVVALLTAVNTPNRETGRATVRQQTTEEVKFKMCSEKHATSKARVEVPPELITRVSGEEG